MEHELFCFCYLTILITARWEENLIFTSFEEGDILMQEHLGKSKRNEMQSFINCFRNTF